MMAAVDSAVAAVLSQQKDGGAAMVHLLWGVNASKLSIDLWNIRVNSYHHSPQETVW